MKPLPARACALVLLVSAFGSGAAAVDPPSFIEMPSPKASGLKFAPSEMEKPAIASPAKATNKPSLKYAKEEKAESEAQALVNERTRTLGAEAKETLRAWLLLVEAIAAQQRGDEAEPMLNKVLPVLTEVFGAEDPETLRAQADLSVAQAIQLKWAEAAALCTRLIPLQTRVLGADSAEVLGTRRRLAGLLFDLGKMSEAEGEYQTLVVSTQAKLGAKDAETLSARRLHARCLHAQEKNAAAAAELRELLTETKQALGGKHRETLACESLLLGVTAALGKNSETEEPYRSLISRATSELGPTDELTLQTRWRFSGVLFELGKRKEAEAEYLQALSSSLTQLSSTNTDTLRTRRDEAKKDHDARHYSGAEGLRRGLVLYLTRLLGPEHPDILRTRLDVATEMIAQGKNTEAEAELHGVLALQARVLGPLNLEILDTCDALAECLKAQRKTVEAMAYAERSLAGRLKIRGKDHIDTTLSQLLVDSLIRQAQPTPDPASEPDAKDRPVALVDGTPILASELKAAIAMEKVYLEYRYSSAPSKLKSELAEMQLTQLDTLINMRLLVNEFKKRKGEIPKAYIEEDLNDTVRDNYHGDRAAFEDYLTRCGMTLERYRVWREQLMMEGSMRDRFAGEVKITDIEQVEDYYKAHPQRWRGAEEVKLNSITLLKTLHETDAETRAQMESLREQIAQGEVFASIARAQSKDSHAEDGGAWGWTRTADLSEAVRDAATTTEKGALSKIIEQEGVFILLRVDDRRSSDPPPFEEVKEAVTKAFKEEKRKKRVEIKLKSLREAARIQKLDSGPV